MTIVDAVIKILTKTNIHMSAKEIYDGIIKDELYTFGAKDPVHVVDQLIRRSCLGLDLPTSIKVKRFKIIDHKDKKTFIFSH